MAGKRPRTGERDRTGCGAGCGRGSVARGSAGLDPRNLNACCERIGEISRLLEGEQEAACFECLRASEWLLRGCSEDSWIASELVAAVNPQSWVERRHQARSRFLID